MLSRCLPSRFRLNPDRNLKQPPYGRTNPLTHPPRGFRLAPETQYEPGELFSATNQPLIAYLRFAYKLGQGDLLDLPAWVYSDGFDIEARAKGSPDKDQMRLMMRSLLADRFGVRTHIQQRTEPVFHLTLASPARTGPMLVPIFAGGCAAMRSPDSRLRLPAIPCGSIGPLPATTPGTGRLGGHGITLKQFAGIISNPYTGLDRPVMDRTGLTGTFDFSLEWSTTPDRAQPPDAGTQPTFPPGSAAPDFREALRKQLGLKLASATGSVGVLVIDRVERPQEN